MLAEAIEIEVVGFDAPADVVEPAGRAVDAVGVEPLGEPPFGVVEMTPDELLVVVAVH